MGDKSKRRLKISISISNDKKFKWKICFLHWNEQSWRFNLYLIPKMKRKLFLSTFIFKKIKLVLI